MFFILVLLLLLVPVSRKLWSLFICQMFQQSLASIECCTAANWWRKREGHDRSSGLQAVYPILDPDHTLCPVQSIQNYTLWSRFLVTKSKSLTFCRQINIWRCKISVLCFAYLLSSELMSPSASFDDITCIASTLLPITENLFRPINKCISSWLWVC